MTQFWCPAIVGTTISLVIAASLTSVAQPIESSPRDGTTRIRYIEPTNLANIGEPGGRRKGGAGRGPCKQYETLTALTPVSQIKQKDTVLGLTTSAQPTFWFYVPAPLTAGLPIEFVLQDGQDNLVYKTNITAAATPAGVVNISLPPTTPPLALNTTYRWTFSIYCNAKAGSESMYVRGMVQRVSLRPTLQQNIDRAKTPLERATLYAANGIWHDALTLLGEQRLQGKGGAIATAWTDLLQQVKLERAATAPLVPCCKPQ